MLLSLLLGAAPPAMAGGRLPDSSGARPIPAVAYDAECRTAIDRLEDLLSNPAAAGYLSDSAADRLARGLALCRTGHVGDGAVLLRKAFASIHVAD